MLTVGSLFSGIGGFDLGLERAGFTIEWQVECDPFCQRVLAARWPGVARAHDVRALFTTDARKSTKHDGWSGVDLLVGGFPCQDLSVAGKRAGLQGERSGLFHEFIRIAQAIKPTWGLVENVPGLFSSHGGRDMATVLEGLRQCWPVVGYCVLDSQYFGVPQRRRRVFFVGGPTEASVEQVLFESEGGRRDLTACGEAGAHVAASLRSRSHKPGVNATGRGGEDDMNIVVQALTNLGSGGPDDNEAQGNHLIPFDLTQLTSGENRSNPQPGDPCHPLAAQGYAPHVAACLNPGHEAKHPYAGDGGTLNIVTHSLRADGFDASEDGTGRGTPLVPISEVGAKTQMGAGRDGCGIGNEGDPMFTLQAGKVHGVGVRRLTPTECERLQGFPDGWTCLCQPLAQYEADRCTCSDGPRYKALGNAVTETVIHWIGQRMNRVASSTRREEP